MKAIKVKVFRSNLGDCTNGGISSKFDDVILPCRGGYIEFDPDNPPENLCKVVKQKNVFDDTTIYYIEPNASPASGHTNWMPGGNFAYSCDSRFSDLFDGMYAAIAIHDRCETWEQCYLLSL